MHSMGQGWPRTQLGHEVGSSGSCRRDGCGGLGRVCCSRLAEGAKSQSRLRVCSWLMQYTLCTNWLIGPLSWQRPHQVQAPRQEKGTVGKGRLVQHLLGTQGERRGSADGASRYKKRGENSLNNGTRLRLSPRAAEASGWEVQCSLCGGWAGH